MTADYCVVTRAGSDRFPLLEWDEDGSRFYRGEPVVVTAPIKLRLGHPVPHNPVMADYHSLPRPVVAPRVKDVLEPLNLRGVQLVPADVLVQGEDVRRYWLLHVYQRIACVDRRHSLLRIDEDDGDILGIQRLVLDGAALEAVPEESRLVFRLAESPSVHLFHRTVVDAVLALRPEGLRFIPTARWNDAADFQGGLAS
ncbi:hypothetical protein FJV41_31230 [Myxococcus llanfairpwllgwyngyllgogerychwyrndrobwllllantysiliogogogochensis]|uniref:Immunity MXAN-0049 protein domain-containing protein n=1 Tax=Myxococcus llanfairpwllgwyngyllgogerychwyrndrobwllllantysiliogogogochensis TaxID=2590453 RepID=A0A540WSK1_9BACT|nr:DUF1629 domain-containing protein [Myxococcus llanfairpwllgwyngyllgogerychwyrndrobwllllantysiliogogogochensis]TQF12001.1 hypothetical protein FJV41_31230 [Myxococcus llanfairpwllgwyngyllgogerychwyrndrobwllllantysiliogogogochensis]